MTPSLLYVVIAALVVAAATQIILFRGPLPEDTRPPVIAFLLLVGLENIYYGAGRMWPNLYNELAQYLPAVLTFKVGYILALAYLNTRLLSAAHPR